MVYQMKNAIIGYPGNLLLDRVSMEIKNKEKIAIVGRNGCGKTTLLKVMAGILDTDNLDSDEDFLIQSDGAPSIGYLEQINFENENDTVKEELLKAYQEMFAIRDKMEQLAKEMETDQNEQLLNQYAKVSNRFEHMGGYTYQYEMEQIFTKFGFELSDMERSIQDFSGGQKTKIAFVKLLLSKPDIMLLDEPTNHLDVETIEWLEQYLKNYNKAVVIVSHDRMFLDRIIDVTYEIEYKKMKRYPGNYSAFLERKRLDYEKQCKDYEAQQKEIERLTLFIEQWKNTPTKVAMTRSKRMQIEHMVKIPKPMRFDTRSMHAKLQPAKESGKDVLIAKNYQIGYDNVLAKVSFELKKGQKLAIIGENGKGKSTLLKTIVGKLEDLGGTIKFGTNVEWAYFDQELLNLDDTKTVINEFWDSYPTLTQTEVRNILGSFLFTGDDVFQPLSQLSGGEKVRLSLAKLMKRQANLLILDEPTNHLDMPGKEALESMLNGYQGTIFFVSHDRYFVKKIADCLLVFEEDGVNYYPYGYDTYCEKKAKKSKEENASSTLKDNTFKVTEINNEDNEIGYSTDTVRGTSGRDTSGNNTSKKDTSGRDRARRERKMAGLEDSIQKTEDKLAKLNEWYSDPDIATDYERLEELRNEMEQVEQELNDLLLEWAGL